MIYFGQKKLLEVLACTKCMIFYSQSTPNQKSNTHRYLNLKRTSEMNPSLIDVCVRLRHDIIFLTTYQISVVQCKIEFM